MLSTPTDAGITCRFCPLPLRMLQNHAVCPLSNWPQDQAVYLFWSSLSRDAAFSEQALIELTVHASAELLRQTYDLSIRRRE